LGIISLKQPTISTLGLSQTLSNLIVGGWGVSKHFLKPQKMIEIEQAFIEHLLGAKSQDE
jgi:hypothetical protein